MIFILFEFDLSCCSGSVDFLRGCDAASCLEELATELEGSTPSDIRTLGFDYNPAGQITERTDTGGNFAFSGHTDQTSIYDHDALNPIIDITETGVQTQTITPTWTDGNLTALVRPGDNGQPETTLYGYDAFNRLTSVNNVAEIELDYDPLGRLTRYTVTNTVTDFVYDGAAMIAEYDDNAGVSTLMRRYVHGPGLDAPLVQFNYTGGVLAERRWLLADERGSIYAHTGEDGSILQANTYDEYGVPGGGRRLAGSAIPARSGSPKRGSITTRPAPIMPSLASSCRPTRSGIAAASISTPMWAGIR